MAVRTLSDSALNRLRQAARVLNTKARYTPSVPPINIEIGRWNSTIGGSKKYIMNDRSDDMIPGPDDIVVESGVGSGSDTAMFGKLASQVLAFEPSPRNYKRAKSSLRRFNNVTLINEGLWHCDDELEIKYGIEQGDDGFFEPDSGEIETTGPKPTIPVGRLDDYVEWLDIERVDFFKVEAEGAEPEIIRGIGNLKIPKVVVNVDEERDGKSTEEEVTELLADQGYEIVGRKISGKILFFKLVK